MNGMRKAMVFVIGNVVGTYPSDVLLALGRSIAFVAGRVPGR